MRLRILKLCTGYIGKRLDDVYIPVETGAFHVTFTWNSLRALFLAESRP